MNNKQNVTTFTDIFNDHELKIIENDLIVQSYKNDALNNNKKLIKFTIPIGEDIKMKLKSYNINIDDNNELNMMWIKGDIEKHVDKGESYFDYTNLIYVTDDNNGKLVIDGESFPIKKGYGYRFNKGLEHETTGTDPEKMRLIIGPISEKGFPVGVPINNNIFYLLVNPPDYSVPYFIPSDNSRFINESQIPDGYVPESKKLRGWYIFHVSDMLHATYHMGDIIKPNTPYTMDSPYFVYPIWNDKDVINVHEKLSRSAYTDNSLIYYKPHSLASGGTAGVKNARVKSRRT
jgi:hypothetical protein